MSLFLALVVLQLVIFGALVLFLRVILTRNISKATLHIQEMDQDSTQKIEEAQKRLREADQYFDDMLLKTKTEAEKEKVRILQEAHASQDMILNQARKQSEDILKQANNAHDAILAEIHLEIEKRSLIKACDLVQEVLPSEISKEMHDRWVAELTKTGLEALARLNASEEVQSAKVISAYALEEDQRAALHEKIQKRIGRAIALEEETDPKLIAGLKILFGSVEIDGSLSFRIRELWRHARR